MMNAVRTAGRSSQPHAGVLKGTRGWSWTLEILLHYYARMINGMRSKAALLISLFKYGFYFLIMKMSPECRIFLSSIFF